MNRIDGKVALVTGGGGTIGRGLCLMLAEAGARVVISGRNLQSIEATVKLIKDKGYEALAIELDVTSEESWDRAINRILGHFKKLNILVNNAGGVGIIGDTHGCEGISLSDWNSVLSVNLNGTFLGVSTCIAVMKDNQDSNSIINISSVSGNMPELRVPYSVAKAGVQMLGKCSAMECRKKGYDNIRVNNILPGGVIDDMDVEPTLSMECKKYNPPARFGRVRDIGKGVIFLASDDSDHITGSDLIIDGGYSASAGGFLSASIIDELIVANK